MLLAFPALVLSLFELAAQAARTRQVCCTAEFLQQECFDCTDCTWLGDLGSPVDADGIQDLVDIPESIRYALLY